MLREWVRRYLAEKGIRTWGFWARREWSESYCFECGHTEVHSLTRNTRYGNWRRDYREIRRLGYKRWKQHREMNRQLSESIHRAYIELMEDQLRPSPIFKALEHKWTPSGR